MKQIMQKKGNKWTLKNKLEFRDGLAAVLIVLVTTCYCMAIM